MPSARSHPKYTHHPHVPTYTSPLTRHPNDIHHPGMSSPEAPAPIAAMRRHPKRWMASLGAMTQATSHPKYTDDLGVRANLPHTRHPNDIHSRDMSKLGFFASTFSTKRHRDCYAPKQSAGRRVSDQRETPRVGPQNRVWGLVKPESTVDCHRLDSGGIRLAHTLRGCARPVNVPDRVTVPQGRVGASS